MNERIKELAMSVQCERHWTEEDIEKFAELIVQEMCTVLDKAQWDKGEDWVCADGTRIIEQVKDHFGVEL